LFLLINSNSFFSSGIFDTHVEKNHGFKLIVQQFYALLMKRILNSMRNYLALVAAALPVLFVVVSLIIEQQIPKPQDSPALLISLDRYRTITVPYTQAYNEIRSTEFTKNYDYFLQQSKTVAHIRDLSSNLTDTCINGRPTDILSYLTCIGERSLMDLNDRHLIAVDSKENDTGNLMTITGFFNNQPYHIPPLSLNMISNALLRQYSVANNRTISVINHPLPRSLIEQVSDFESQQFFGFRMASSVVFGLGFMMAAFSVFLIKERMSKAKHLQFLSGADGIIFWASTFLWDAVYYTVSVFLIFIIWTIFYHTDALKDNLEVFLTDHRMGYTVLLYIMYGFSQIPLTYLMTYLFSIPASGFAWITIFNIITSKKTNEKCQSIFDYFRSSNATSHCHSFDSST